MWIGRSCNWEVFAAVVGGEVIRNYELGMGAEGRGGLSLGGILEDGYLLGRELLGCFGVALGGFLDEEGELLLAVPEGNVVAGLPLAEVELG